MAAVAGRADLVGVFVAPSAAACDQAASRYRLAAVQVHGAFDRGLVTACPVPVIPVFNVEDRATASTIDWPPDTLMMLDGLPDPGALPGGTGHRVPLPWAADIARHREILLAGGLGADDVAEAIAAVRPAGVDASSRLERRPGRRIRSSCGGSCSPRERLLRDLEVDRAMSALPRGRFDGYGGAYVPETLVPALEELEAEIDAAFADAAFTADLDRWLADYAGRPTPVTHARRLGDAHRRRADLAQTRGSAPYRARTS